ncbi:unnamed protein product [Darwinula stevensoni]|uniref:G-protein coupled receptors family 1 profile domain-containing protein n=1 Tax=Darwinula stevensoni TaxID=69355 RepID=A0A7R9FR32_9CRUS|nr:unnamed protein product [Darwinula stevensoni]CAG0900860.1 unnamed protein product [Darwinula stevensoni]
MASSLEFLLSSVVFCFFGVRGAMGQEYHLYFVCDQNMKNCHLQVQTTENDNYIVETAFLVFIVLVGFCSNFLIVVTVASSIKLRLVPNVAILFQIALLNLFEICLNITMGIAYRSRTIWYSNSMLPCNINVYFCRVVPIILVYFMLYLTLERYLTFKHHVQFRKMVTSTKVQILCLATWCLVFVCLVPIPLGLFTCFPSEARYACVLLDPVARVMEIAIAAAGLGVPLLTIGVIFVLVVCYIKREHEEDQRSVRPRGQTVSNLIFKTPKLIQESMPSRTAGLVLIIFLIFPLPNMILVEVENIMRTTRPIPRNSTAANVSGIDSNVLPEVPGNQIEMAFTWLRFLFVVMFPLAVYLLHGDLRAKSASLVACWSSDFIFKAAATRAISATLPRRLNGSKYKDFENNGKRKRRSQVNFKTPLLFAMSEGLYLRTPDSEYGSKKGRQQTRHRQETSRTHWAVMPEFVQKLCDNFLVVDVTASSEGSVESDGIRVVEVEETPTPVKEEPKVPALVIVVEDPPRLEDHERGAKKSVHFASTSRLVVEIPGSIGPREDDEELLLGEDSGEGVSRQSSGQKEPPRRRSVSKKVQIRIPISHRNHAVLKAAIPSLSGKGSGGVSKPGTKRSSASPTAFTAASKRKRSTVSPTAATTAAKPGTKRSSASPTVAKPGTKRSSASPTVAKPGTKRSSTNPTAAITAAKPSTKRSSTSPTAASAPILKKQAGPGSGQGKLGSPTDDPGKNRKRKRIHTTSVVELDSFSNLKGIV